MMKINNFYENFKLTLSLNMMNIIYIKFITLVILGLMINVITFLCLVLFDHFAKLSLAKTLFYLQLGWAELVLFLLNPTGHPPPPTHGSKMQTTLTINLDSVAFTSNV